MLVAVVLEISLDSLKKMVSTHTNKPASQKKLDSSPKTSSAYHGVLPLHYRQMVGISVKILSGTSRIQCRNQLQIDAPRHTSISFC